MTESVAERFFKDAARHIAFRRTLIPAGTDPRDLVSEAFLMSARLPFDPEKAGWNHYVERIVIWTIQRAQRLASRRSPERVGPIGQADIQDKAKRTWGAIDAT